jgi:transitional endoplasmic reticulum ATPase
VHKDRITDLEAVLGLPGLLIAEEDFQNALKNIKPSAIREVVVQIPRDVSWESVGGLDDVRQLLIENVVHGIRNRQAFQAVGIKPAQGVLLHGPPGTGKTLLAKVIARESGANCLAIRGPEVKSKWFGESEERVRFLFAKAREVAPCIILLDELDAIAATRGGDHQRVNDSIVNQLLAEMDGLDTNDNVFVIGTTNQLSLIDQGMLRPGRFDYQVFVPAPDDKARASIYRVHLKNKPDSSEIGIEELSAKSEGLSGADIAEVCRQATLDALRKNQFNADSVRLTMDSFLKAIEIVKRTQGQIRQVGF